MNLKVVWYQCFSHERRASPKSYVQDGAVRVHALTQAQGAGSWQLKAQTPLCLVGLECTAAVKLNSLVYRAVLNGLQVYLHGYLVSLRVS